METAELNSLHLRLWRAASPAADAARRHSAQAGQDYLAARTTRATPTPLFDPEYYLQQLPWFIRDKTDALGHYLSTGWAAGLSPHVAFDVGWLAARLAVTRWKEPPLIAYFEATREVSPHPLFDVDVYRRHVDLAAQPYARLFECFLDWSETARAPFSRLFSLLFYARSEPVTRAGTINPLVHYLNADVERRRDPNPMFHNRWYDVQYPAAKGQDADALIRFAKAGLAEGHLPNPFARQEMKLIEADSGIPAEILLPYVDISAFDRLPDRTAGRGRGAVAADGASLEVDGANGPGRTERGARRIAANAPLAGPAAAE